MENAKVCLELQSKSTFRCWHQSRNYFSLIFWKIRLENATYYIFAKLLNELKCFFLDSLLRSFGQIILHQFTLCRI